MAGGRAVPWDGAPSRALGRRMRIRDHELARYLEVRDDV